MKKFKLRQLLIDRADLVDKGANQEAFIELFKRDDTKPSVPEALDRARKRKTGGPTVDKKKKRPAFLDEELEGEPKEKSKDEEMTDEEKKKLLSKGMSDTLEAITKGLVETDVFVDDATGGDLRDMLPPETLSSIEEVLKSAWSAEPVGEAGMSEPSALSATDLEELVEYVEKLEAEVVDLTKRLEDDPLPEETEITKALTELPEDVAKAIEAERTELAEKREEVAKADIEKADREYVAKMEALPGIVDSPKDFGPVLRQVAAFDADLAKSIEAVLEAANARIEKGDLFTEVGKVTTTTGGDAMEKATSIAKSMVEATPELSLEEARSRVWETNPELYAEYNAEREAAKK